MIDCTQLIEHVAGFSLVKACDVLASGFLRIATPFRYSDGSSIDLFLGPSNRIDGELKLTDMGETTGYLLDLHVKPWSTQKRKFAVSDVCHSLSVQKIGGELCILFDRNELASLSDAIVRLAQACIRIAELAITQRFRTVTAFGDDFEEFVAGTELRYEYHPQLVSRFGTSVFVDYRVFGRQTRSLIQTISTPNREAAHSVSNEVFRRWYDLQEVRNTYQFLTIYDSANDSMRYDDLARLGEASTILGFPAEHEAIQASLAA